MAIVKGVKQEMEVVWFKVHPLYDELGVVARFSLDLEDEFFSQINKCGCGWECV